MATAALIPARRGKAFGLVALGIIISAALGLLFDVVPRLQAISFGLVFVGLCAVILTFESFRNGRRDLFSPLSLITAYHAIGFGLKGVVDLMTGQSKIAHALDPTSAQFANLMIEVFAYASLGLISLVAGDRLARRHEKTRVLETPTPLGSPMAVRTAVALGIGLSLIGMSVLVARFGSVVFTNPSFIAVEGTIGLFWLYPLMYASLYGWAIAIANRWAQGLPATRWRIAIMLITSALVYSVTSSKASLVSAVLILIVAGHRTVRPVRMSVLFALGAAFLVALPLLYLHREYGFTAESLSRITPGMVLIGAQIFLGRSYLADAFGSVLLYSPRVYPYRFGAPWLELFYFWIPRSWWPNKPLSQSLEFGHTYMSSYFQRQDSFLAPSLLGDAYLNLGPVGILLVFGLAGYLLRRWYYVMCGPKARIELVVVYGVSAYWIAIASEQSLSVFVTLSLSYVAVAGVLAVVARRLYSAVELDPQRTL
jgi:hypothetical protein